jgi:hypothetical protein
VAMEEADTANGSPNARRHDTHEGDVIQGLRSGLIYSLAIWSVLLIIGARLFA